MAELMTLKEAIFKIPEGKLNLTKEEFIQASYFMEYDGQKCELRESVKNSGYFFWYFKDSANFTDDEFLVSWLEIIPAEPRVMKAEWYVNRFDPRKTTVSSANYSYEDMIICFNQAHKNGRLERDLEYKDLREIAEIVRITILDLPALTFPGSKYVKLKEAIKNLKPLPNTHNNTER